MTSSQICLALLGVTAGLLLFAEFNKRTSSARVAAVLAIIAVIGADFFFLRAMPSGTGWEFEQTGQSGSPGARERRSAAGGGGRGQALAEPQDHDGGQSEPNNADGVGNSRPDGGSSLGDKADNMARDFAVWMRSWLFPKMERTAAITSLHEFRDCATCPEMVRIRAGSLTIGAGEDDVVAEAAERPQREMRVWPGFAVSRTEITLGDMKAAGINIGADGVCNADQTNAANPATCVTLQDVERYVSWLGAQTGRPYRLLSAAEWEFAARTTALAGAGAARMGGGVAELAADCWPVSVAATEIRAAVSDAAEIGTCSHRIVKDGADSEDVQWQRPSARRAIKVDARSPRVGFRVMRPFDLTARNGY